MTTTKPERTSTDGAPPSLSAARAPTDAELDLQARRRVLAVLAFAPALAACVVGSEELPVDDQDPDHDGGATGPGEDASDDGGSGDSAAPQDSGTTPADTGSACTGTLAGAVSSWAVGTFKKVGTAFVGRDAAGFWAVWAVCTHNNKCALGTPTSAGISCPCHGAKFDVNGKVTKSPATKPLPNYQVTVCNGNVYVNTAKTVTLGTRVSA